MTIAMFVLALFSGLAAVSSFTLKSSGGVRSVSTSLNVRVYTGRQQVYKRIRVLVEIQPLDHAFTVSPLYPLLATCSCTVQSTIDQQEDEL